MYDELIHENPEKEVRAFLSALKEPESQYILINRDCCIVVEVQVLQEDNDPELYDIERGGEECVYAFLTTDFDSAHVRMWLVQHGWLFAGSIQKDAINGDERMDDEGTYDMFCKPE